MPAVTLAGKAAIADSGKLRRTACAPSHGGSFSGRSASSSWAHATLSAAGGVANMIVTDISWSPSSPAPGDHVVFTATVQNTGGQATPDGTIVDVLFSIALAGVEQARTWSDDNSTSLAAGASRAQAANGSPQVGVNYWLASQGTFSVGATVNSNHRFPELTETDNVRVESITVSTGPAGIPDAPSLFASAGNAYVDLSWGAPNDNGAAITTYRVYRDGALIASPLATAYHDTGVVNNTTYSYTVSAVNSVGEGPRSAPQIAQPFTGSNVPSLLPDVGDAVPAARLVGMMGVGANFTTQAESATWKAAGFGGISVACGVDIDALDFGGGGRFTGNDVWSAPYRTNTKYWGQRYWQGGDAWGGGAPTSEDATLIPNVAHAANANGMEFWAITNWRRAESIYPSAYDPPIGDWWNDTLQGQLGDWLGGLGGALNRLPAGTGIWFDWETDHWYARHVTNKPTATAVGWVVYETSTGKYWRTAAGPTWVEITLAEYQAKLEQRGFEHGTKLFTEFPECVLASYDYKGAGSINDPIQGMALGTWRALAEKDWYMFGVFRAMATLDAPGFFQMTDSSYYHTTENQGHNMSLDNCEKYGMQLQLAVLSQNLPAATRDYMMGRHGNSPFTWAGTDPSPFYYQSQETEPTYSNSQKRHRRWGMFGRRFEFCFGMDNDNGSSSWGSPRGFEPAGARLWPLHNHYTFPTGRTTGMVAAASTASQDSTLITVTDRGQVRAFNTVTLTIDAKHPYGIEYAHWKLFAADGTTMIGQGKAVMTWDISACGNSYTSLNFGGTNPTDFMRCVCTIPNASPGLYVTVDVYSCVGQRTSRRYQMGA